MKIIWFTPWDEALNCHVTYRAAATLERMPLNTCNLCVFSFPALNAKRSPARGQASHRTGK